MRINTRRRRYKLWKKSPHCFWCNKKLKWKQTTLDHIYQRIKTNKRPERGKTVLSCKRCNIERARAEESTLSIMEKWEKSKSPPKFSKVFSRRSDITIKKRAYIIYYYLKNKINLTH